MNEFLGSRLLFSLFLLDELRVQRILGSRYGS